MLARLVSSALRGFARAVAVLLVLQSQMENG